MYLKSKGWNVDQVSSVWSVGPSVAQCRQWNVEVLKQLGGSSVVADVWHTLKSRNQVGHYKRPALDEVSSNANTKKVRLEPLLPSPGKGTHSKIVPSILSPCNGLNQPSDQSQPNSDNVSSPTHYKPIVIEAKPRRMIKARRPGRLSTPRITEWLLNCPSPSPVLSPTTSDPIPTPAKSCTSPPKEILKKKRTRKNKTDKIKNKAQATSSSSVSDRNNLLSFLTPATKKDVQLGRRLSSMSPELRPRQSSEDQAAFVPTNEQQEPECDPSKEV